MENTMKVEYDARFFTGNTENNQYQISPVVAGIEYYTIPTFEKKYDTSRKSIYRSMDKLDNLERWRYRIKQGGRTYVSPGILFLNQKLRKKLNKQEFAQWLSVYTWDYALTIGYCDTYSAEQVKRHMTSFWKKLIEKHGRSRMNIFFTTERYACGGYHLHAVLRVMDPESKAQSVDMVKSHFKPYSGNVLIENFDTKDVWVSYILKQVDKNVDGWDFFIHKGNNPTAMNLI